MVRILEPAQTFGAADGGSQADSPSATMLRVGAVIVDVTRDQLVTTYTRFRGAALRSVEPAHLISTAHLASSTIFWAVTVIESVTVSVRVIGTVARNIAATPSVRRAELRLATAATIHPNLRRIVAGTTAVDQVPMSPRPLWTAPDLTVADR